MVGGANGKRRRWLLLTSREQPAGLAGEVLFPAPNEPLSGLDTKAGAELYIFHSTKAKDKSDAHRKLARDIARVTEGHPLALALLAGEYDTSQVSAKDFLEHWETELASAARPSLMGHHRTFTLAFERSYNHLNADDQARLRALSIFPFPFYAEGAALLWGLTSPQPSPAEGEGERALQQARDLLGGLTRRNLLEIDGWFKDNTPSAYRFQPALRQEVAHRLDDAERERLKPAFAAYSAWFVALARDSMGREPAVARRAQGATRTLIEQIDALPAENVARYCWLLGTVLYQFGQITQAEQVLQRGMAAAQAQGDTVREERILFALARNAVLRGELDRALADYRRAAELAQQEKNEGEYSVVISEMAGIYVTRGDLNGAMQWYRQSLQIQEQLGDLQGKSATLSMVANLYMENEDWDTAEGILNQALEISRQMGDMSGIAFKTVKLGQVAQARGDFETALARYREGLENFERLGMPRESAQVQEMIAALENPNAPRAAQPSNPLQQASAQARAAASQGDMDAAIQAQAQAVEMARARGNGRDELVALSVMLYNLSNYYAQAEQFDKAVDALEQVVALDEQTGHQDLESDRQQLEQMRQLAALSPEERAARRARARETGTENDADAPQAQLDALPPEQRAQLEAAAREAQARLAQMTPEERAALADRARREQIQNIADQTRDAAIRALRGEIPREQLAPQIERVAAQAAEGEAPDSPWAEVAVFLRAVSALLQGNAKPVVPSAYAGHWAAIRDARPKEIHEGHQGH
ncbi:MAG: tetratricopeptide repeat protein [Chloroflexi bacterium]|nr:tetratricopeptide repeat protein [Chloroflexota bacterium]